MHYRSVRVVRYVGEAELVILCCLYLSTAFRAHRTLWEDYTVSLYSVAMFVLWMEEAVHMLLHINDAIPGKMHLTQEEHKSLMVKTGAALVTTAVLVARTMARAYDDQHIDTVVPLIGVAVTGITLGVRLYFLRTHKTSELIAGTNRQTGELHPEIWQYAGTQSYQEAPATYKVASDQYEPDDEEPQEYNTRPTPSAWNAGPDAAYPGAMSAGAQNALNNLV